MSILSMQNVTYSYIADKPVLNDVTVSFELGRMYVILGPSGCGKTTLLSLLGGLDVPQSGQILFDGNDIAHNGLDNHRRNNISFVFQSYNLIDYMNAYENVLLTAKSDSLSMLKKLGLTEDESKRNVLKLSGGQQQRVAIARALASESPIILADEPTGNLDEDIANDITSIFVEAAHLYNKCVIIVSHSTELAKQADTRFELSHGALSTADVVSE